MWFFVSDFFAWHVGQIIYHVYRKRGGGKGSVPYTWVYNHIHNSTVIFCRLWSVSPWPPLSPFMNNPTIHFQPRQQEHSPICCIRGGGYTRIRVQACNRMMVNTLVRTETVRSLHNNTKTHEYITLHGAQNNRPIIAQNKTTKAGHDLLRYTILSKSFYSLTTMSFINTSTFFPYGINFPRQIHHQ